MNINETLSITPPAGTTQGGLYVNQTASGSGTPSLNGITISDDVAVVTDYLTGFNFTHNFGGSNLTGARVSAKFDSHFTATSSASNPAKAYTNVGFLMQVMDNDGGTAMAPAGAFYGINPIFQMDAAATHLQYGSAMEVNTISAVGSSVYYKNMLALVSFDFVQGTTYDAGLAISAGAGTIGLKDLILIGPMHGQFPSHSSGSIMRTISGSFAKGIDFSTSTISGNAWASPGATIDGRGVAAFSGIVLIKDAATPQFTLTNLAGSGLGGMQYFVPGSVLMIDTYAAGSAITFRPNSAERLRVDLTATPGHTALLLYDVDNARVERVTVGAANSGGNGFKCLRIPN